MGLMDRFEFDPDKVPNIKLGIHVLQMVIAFVIFILEIIVFRAKDAAIVGNNGWTFGMCFLTIPGVLYLALTPRFERTRRAAQPHAMVVVDAIWTVLWLSAFASQTAYTSSGQCGEACTISKAISGIAFFETFAFVLTSALSAYSLNYYQNNGYLPGYENLGSGKGENIDPDKAAFSMAPHDEEAYAPVGMHDHHDDHEDDHDNPYHPDSYNASNTGGGGGAYFDNDTSYRPHSPVRPHSPLENPFDNTNRLNNNPSPHNDPYSDYGASTSYLGASTSHLGASTSHLGGSTTAQNPVYAPPSAEDYDPTRPAQFPTANYDRTLH